MSVETSTVFIWKVSFEYYADDVLKRESVHIIGAEPTGIDVVGNLIGSHFDTPERARQCQLIVTLIQFVGLASGTALVSDIKTTLTGLQ